MTKFAGALLTLLRLLPGAVRRVNQLTPYRRRVFLVPVAMAILPTAVMARSARPTPRLGYLAADCTPSPRDLAFLDGLHQLGYRIGTDIAIERSCYTTSGEATERLNELIKMRIDVLFVVGPQLGRLARAATRDIPIVCGSCGDPIEAGIVTSLNRPGGNVTGNASLSAELIAKRLELIKEALPKTVRLAILSNPDNPDTPPALRALDQAGRNLGVVLDRFDFRSIDDFASAFAQAAQAGVSAVLLVDDNFVYAGRAEIAWHALKSRLPTMVGQPEGAAAGCLFAYGPNRAALFRSAAGYVDKILKGAKPADLPIQQPTKFELVINLKTAKALGLEMPPTLLARADEVIE